MWYINKMIFEVKVRFFEMKKNIINIYFPLLGDLKTKRKKNIYMVNNVI